MPTRIPTPTPTHLVTSARYCRCREANEEPIRKVSPGHHCTTSMRSSFSRFGFEPSAFSYCGRAMQGERERRARWGCGGEPTWCEREACPLAYRGEIYRPRPQGAGERTYREPHLPRLMDEKVTEPEQLSAQVTLVLRQCGVVRDRLLDPVLAVLDTWIFERRTCFR